MNSVEILGDLYLKYLILKLTFLCLKKKLVHMSLIIPLICYEFFKEMINYIKRYWNEKKKKNFLSFFVFFFNPRLNQSLKWRFDYIIVANDKFRGKRKYGRTFRWVLWNVETKLQREFSRYIVKIPQVKGSFNVLINEPRGKILEDNLKQLFDDIKYISKKVYRQFSDQCNSFRHQFFLYFKLVRCYSNYQYHFLVVRKDYEYEY